MKEAKVNIAQIIGTGICVSAPDGHKIHNIIFQHITDKKRVRISFANVTRLTTAFLNAAIGQLYGEFSEDELRTHLAPPVDAGDRQLTQLKIVVDRAKDYFKNPESSRSVFTKVTGIEND